MCLLFTSVYYRKWTWLHLVKNYCLIKIYNFQDILNNVKKVNGIWVKEEKRKKDQNTTESIIIRV